MILKKIIILIALSALVHPFDLTFGIPYVHGSELYPEAEEKKYQHLPQKTENDAPYINKILPRENNNSTQSRERVITGETFNSNPNHNTKLSAFYLSLSSRHEQYETYSRNATIHLYNQNKQNNTNEIFEDLLKDLPSKKIREKRQVKILDKLIEKGNKICRERQETNALQAKL